MIVVFATINRYLHLMEGCLFCTGDWNADRHHWTPAVYNLKQLHQ